MTEVKPPSLSIPKNVEFESRDETTVPRTEPTVKFNLNYQNKKQTSIFTMKPNNIRIARTPNTISAESCIILLGQLHEGLSNLTEVIPDLEKVQGQILEIKESMIARQEDLVMHCNSEIMSGQLPPKTPAMKLKLDAETPSTPAAHHPFTRPDSSQVTLEHWIYDLQKNVWLMNDKCLRYENSNTTILNSNSRKRKLIDLNVEVNTSWVNLMLNLGNILAQEQDSKQKTTSANLNKLAVATGITDWQDLEPSDVQKLYMQGEKYLLGCGVPQSFDLAYKRYQSASNLNYPEATNMLGVMNEFGIGHDKDMAAAVKYYTLASNQNNADSMNHLGRLYETGKGCEVSTKTAYALYKKASSLGQLDATNNYAYMLEHGIGCNQNLQLAIETYKIAAGKGYARAQNALGNCFYKGVGVKRDYFQAVANYKLASDQGYPAAQNNLGICFEEGHGVPKDLSQAKLYYKKAAEKKHANATSNLGFILVLEGSFMEAIQQFYLAKALGRYFKIKKSVEACYHLGYLYETGCSDSEGVILHPDVDMALRFYDEASVKGHVKSILRQASILICGPERLVNIPKAIKYLLVAAGPKPISIDAERDDNQNSKMSKTGSADAQNILGELCEIGLQGNLDESPDVKQAVEWYRLAVKQGHARAMFNLAALYEAGLEVSIDMEKAVKLYKEVI